MLGMEQKSHEIVINFDMKHENSDSQLVLLALSVIPILGCSIWAEPLENGLKR